MKSAEVLASALFCLMLVTGCAGTPYTYTSENELKPGPGLFSGEDGEITLINRERQNGEEDIAE